jgi:hypothetical protein
MQSGAAAKVNVINVKKEYNRGREIIKLLVFICMQVLL